MNLFLQIVFVGLVIADAALTYLVIASGKGVEGGKLMKWIIKYPIMTVIVTMIGTLLVLELIIESGFYFWLGPLDLALLFVCWHNWRILRG